MQGKDSLQWLRHGDKKISVIRLSELDGRFQVANKKRAVLGGPLYSSGTEALCADTKFASLSSAYIYLNALKVNEPAAPCMTVGVADGVSCCRPAAAAITDS